MVGDLSYDDNLLKEGKLPGVGAKRAMGASVAQVNALRHALPGLVVLPAHDPAAASRLAAAVEPPTAADPRPTSVKAP